MREILFRGKSELGGKWYEGFPVPTTTNGYVKGYEIIEREGINYDELDYYNPSYGAITVIPETIGQYTGLTDKNGKKIFEGDIVRYLYEPGKGYWNSDQNSVIEWKSTGFYMRGIMGTNKYACTSGWLVSTPHGDGKCFEVIGNIHDNPELLKEATP